MKPRVLIVDDDSTIRSMYARYLLCQGYNIRAASTLAEAEKHLSSRRFDALILDMILPDGNSLDSVASMRESYPDMAIVMMTAEGGVRVAVEAMRRGADNFLCKPVSLEDLDVFLRKGLEVGSLRRTQIAQRRQAKKEEPYAGETPPWKAMMELASVVAENDSVALFVGETGTGKGVLARWVHQHGPRSSQPFVEVNCSSLGGDLLASELFGHVKGAFTSAVQDKQGLIEVASDGTLFLDEIGDMDIAVQAQFLKVIEEKRYRRVGDVKERSSEFRLICATNHDLEELCQKGDFRTDLFYRINVFPVRMPPLRDMRKDMPGLLDYILKEQLSYDGELTSEVVDMLMDYPWPGNIREVRNILERAILLASGAPLRPEHFPGLSSPSAIRELVEPGLNLSQLEESKIEAALQRFDGNIQKAAKALGVSRATLYRRLKRNEGNRVKHVSRVD